MTADVAVPTGAGILTGNVADADILVKARAVTKRFGGLVAVNAVDFDIPRGSIVSLIGPNGAGKTTFFNMITGAYVPTSGEITFDGHPIVTSSGRKVKSMRPHEVTKLGIGRTFQNIRLFGTMSALDNVLVGQHPHMRSRWWDAILRTPRNHAEDEAAIERGHELLEFVGLGARPHAWARNLPYGDQRRLEIGAGARDESEAPVARRTDGRHERQRDARADGIHPPPPLRARPDGPAHRARYAGRHGDQRPRHRPRLRRGPRRGSPAEVRANPRVIEAYLGRGAAEGA